MVVYRGMLENRIREWSISYGVVRQHLGEWEGKTVNFLDEVDILEISSVWAGANPFTETVEVKRQWYAAGHPSSDKWPTVKPRHDVAYWNGKIDEAAAGKRAPRVTRPTVDDLMLQEQMDAIQRVLARTEQAEWVDENAERSRYLAEFDAIAGAEQAAWMHINTVLDPVPVRVDARMRPDR
jgi:Caudovirus prohead serine protease